MWLGVGSERPAHGLSGDAARDPVEDVRAHEATNPADLALARGAGRRR